MRAALHSAIVLLCASFYAGNLSGEGIGFDTGCGARELVEKLGHPEVTIPRGVWLRIRGVADARSRLTEEQERKALTMLHERGYRTCVLLMPDPKQWASGVRSNPSSALPIDLRDAYHWLADLQRTYGDVVDAWEIGNEPDIAFLKENAETYAAFFQACSLGAASIQPATGAIESTKKYARVVPAALALPPGPYLERLLACHLLSCADGFNFHYYGYAEDFSGVYAQFADAVGAELALPPAVAEAKDPLNSVTKALPVFVTEWGYGLLTAKAALTAKGRMRQLNWFRLVADQVRQLRIEAPLAFYLQPYYEQATNEFGLTATTSRGFTASEFEPNKNVPWTENVGKTFEGNAITPALAYLFKTGKNYPAKNWTVHTTPASPVVMDLVAGKDVLPFKACGGYMLLGKANDTLAIGTAELRLCNFSDRPITGILTFPGETERVTLPPGEMRVMPVELSVDASRFALCDWTARFTSLINQEKAQQVSSMNAGNGSPSYATEAVFQTTLFPNAEGMQKKILVSFDHVVAQAAENRGLLLSRKLATDEPPLFSHGRWLVSKGVDIVEDTSGWHFLVTSYPNEPLRPAMAELPLPANFAFPTNTMLRFDYRTPGTDSCERFDVYFRTTNGNLYTIWPPLVASSTWQICTQNQESFTMAFWGRANLPWRFSDNKPAALVFFFRPKRLPTTYDVKDVGIVRWATSIDSR
jgi:hypothetical protein